jgi:hypothetical protein
MNWKTTKKSTSQNIAFIAFISLLLFSPLGPFVKVQLSRLLAFSPKTIIASEQKKISSGNWQLVDSAEKSVSLESIKEN